MPTRKTKKNACFKEYASFIGDKLASKLFFVESSFKPTGEANLSTACFYSDMDLIGYCVSTDKRRNLYLGCGREPNPKFTNLDVLPADGVDVVADLEMGPDDRLPLEDDGFDCLYSHMTLEHIKNTLRLGEELWRITRHTGILYAHVPWWSSYRTWGDPTHVKAFSEQSFSFWSQDHYEKSAGAKGCMGQYNPKMNWKVMGHILVLCDNQRGKTKKDLNFACAHLTNVISHLFVILQCYKPT